MTKVIESFNNLCLVIDGLSGVSVDANSFPSGASIEEIELCEKKNKWQFPNELKSFLAQMNGEADGAADPLFISGIKFCSLATMVKVKEAFLGVEPNLINNEPGEFRSIEKNLFIPKDRRWQRYWIPLAAEDTCETVLFLDPKPVNTNHENVIFWSYEDTSCGPPIATSIAGLFDSIAEYVRGSSRLPTVTKLPPIKQLRS